MSYKTGIGYDVHRFAENRPLFLGGVEISWPKGLEGHSDADVLLHAIGDALLGAMGAGDIGEHFPPTDEKYRDISSRILLEEIRDLLSAQGFIIQNLDTIITTEEPHLKDYKALIGQSIAEILKIDKTLVNVKAKTAEGLGPIGERKGIEAWATVLLRQTKT